LPRVASILCASNVAWDPYKRVSAHAVFSGVPVHELPYKFPGTFYVVATLLGGTDGQHKVGLLSEKGVLELKSKEQAANVRLGVALVVLPVVECKALRAGRHKLTLTVDGRPLEPAFAFTVRVEENE
jgi:hypothetical protein